MQWCAGVLTFCERAQECDEWGRGNYCNSNPRFMWYACRKTCGTCFKPDLQVHSGPPSLFYKHLLGCRCSTVRFLQPALQAWMLCLVCPEETHHICKGEEMSALQRLP